MRHKIALELHESRLRESAEHFKNAWAYVRARGGCNEEGAHESVMRSREVRGLKISVMYFLKLYIGCKNIHKPLKSRGDDGSVLNDWLSLYVGLRIYIYVGDFG
jgi:hypothetical protein